MVKFHFNLSILLFVISSSFTLAQTTLDIISPLDLDGTVKLNISNFQNHSKGKSDHDLLSVFIKNETEEYISNAIQGQYRTEDDYLVFEPYFPFENNMTYVIRARNEKSENSYSYQSFQIEKKKEFEQAKVVSIYPSSSQLPENLLRFYIYFNTPMKKGQALKHIRMIDGEGNIDNHAFMEFKQELWSKDGKRLTILFDPGRIKRGVSTNLLRGPALIEGKKYELLITGDWEDVYGQSLSINSTKKIEVVKPYQQQIKVNNWAINKPGENSYDTLTMHFDRIIDHALIQSMIRLVNEEGNPIDGHWEIVKEEQSIMFIPEKKWEKGNYKIIADSRLEDVAGNNLQNLLDYDKTDNENNSKTHQYIDFKI